MPSPCARLGIGLVRANAKPMRLAWLGLGLLGLVWSKPMQSQGRPNPKPTQSQSKAHAKPMQSQCAWLGLAHSRPIQSQCKTNALGSAWLGQSQCKANALGLAWLGSVKANAKPMRLAWFGSARSTTIITSTVTATNIITITPIEREAHVVDQ